MDRRYRALLIGNSLYRNDMANLPTLIGPPNDTAAVSAALSQVDYGLFAPEDIEIVSERTSHEIAAAMEPFFRDAAAGDVLLLYFSGHGKLDEYGKLRLCAANTIADRLISTAISPEQINDMIEGSAAAGIIIVLDCCHSGAFKGADVAAAFAPVTGRGRYVITACTDKQVAYDAIEPHRLSRFTQHLVAGLTGRARPRTGATFISLDDLYQYTYDEMTAVGRQTPTSRSTMQGTFPIARATLRRKIFGVSPRRISLTDLEPGEQLPVERIRLRGLQPGDTWTATTEASWVDISTLDDHFELRINPQPGKARANVEVLHHRSGESRVVRIFVHASAAPMPSPPLELTPAPLSEATVAISDYWPTILSAHIEQVAGVRQAVLVGYDGLPRETAGPLDRNDTELFSAGVAGVCNGGGMAASLVGGGWLSILAEFDVGYLNITPTADGGRLALLLSENADLGSVIYESAMLVHTLTVPKARADDDAAAVATTGLATIDFATIGLATAKNAASAGDGAAAEAQEPFRWLLDDMVKRQPGLDGCLVASVDGFAIGSSSDLKPGIRDSLAAAVSSLFGSARAVAQQLRSGKVRGVAVETDAGYLLATPFGEFTLLAQVLDGSADLGQCGYEARIMADRVAQLFAV